MLKRRKRYKKTKFSNQINFSFLSDNYLLILFLIIFGAITYSIIEYNFSEQKQINVNNYNLNQIKKLDLNKLYNNKNLNHHEVKLWILNNTNQRGLASKIRDCFEKGYIIKNKKIKGDYSILKQDNFTKDDQYDLGHIDENKTQIFVHIDIEEKPEFKTHIQEFLSFSGFPHQVIKYMHNWKLSQERDITIVVGNDWNENSKLNYCKEPIN
tara:strand:- start:296 stop:928 length:633 start_codon:yes stop_codon:yes gene_type:complete